MWKYAHHLKIEINLSKIRIKYQYLMINQNNDEKIINTFKY